MDLEFCTGKTKNVNKTGIQNQQQSVQVINDVMMFQNLSGKNINNRK